MPRDGSGTADNATPEGPGHNIIHGTGKEVRLLPSHPSYPSFNTEDAGYI